MTSAGITSSGCKWAAPFQISHAWPCDLAPFCRCNSGPAATGLWRLRAARSAPFDDGLDYPLGPLAGGGDQLLGGAAVGDEFFGVRTPQAPRGRQVVHRHLKMSA